MYTSNYCLMLALRVGSGVNVNMAMITDQCATDVYAHVYVYTYVYAYTHLHTWIYILQTTSISDITMA